MSGIADSLQQTSRLTITPLRVQAKLGDTSCFNQHPWMHLNFNTILNT